MAPLGDPPRDVHAFDYHEGTIVLARGVKQGEIMVASFAENGETHERAVGLAGKGKSRCPLNAVAILGGKACVFYDEWDKRTGLLSLFVQQYRLPNLEADGAPVRYGEIPLDAKGFHGARVAMEMRHSPNREKTLLILDKIQQGGIKLALCWVFDNNMDLEWSGGYRLPVQAMSSESKIWLMDNGRVYYRVSGVVLEEDDLKEKRDGSVEVRKNQDAHKHGSTSWFQLRGEEFMTWEEGSASLVPVQSGAEVWFAGLEPGGPQKSGQWALYRHDGTGFAPKLVAKQPWPHAIKGVSRFTKLDNELIWAMPDLQGDFYIALVQDGGTGVVKVDKQGSVAWSKMLPWDNALFVPVGDKLVSYRWLNNPQMRKALNNMAYKELTTQAGLPTRPVLLTMDADGNHRTTEILDPAYKVESKSYTQADMMAACGCFVFKGKEKGAKGFSRVRLLD